MEVRVPIVDDSPAIRTFIRPVLEMSGLDEVLCLSPVVVVLVRSAQAWTRRMLEPEGKEYVAKSFTPERLRVEQKCRPRDARAGGIPRLWQELQKPS